MQRNRKASAATQKKVAKTTPTTKKPLHTTRRKLTTKRKVAKIAPLSTAFKPTLIKFSEETTAEVAATSAAAPVQEVEQYEVYTEAPVLFTQRDLGLAAHQGDVLKLKECLAQTTPKLNINFKDGYGQTPLIHAIKQRHVKTMQLLIKEGADINLADDQKKWPPFFYAIRRNSVSLFRTFMQHKPETHLTVAGNKTAMTIAGEAGCQITILNDLLELGFNVNHRDNQGKTPIMYAAATSEVKDLEWWLNEGCNPLTKDKHGKNAIDYSKNRAYKHNFRLLTTRASEMRRLHKIDINDDEDAAVKAALQNIKNNINEKNKLKKVAASVPATQ